MFSVLKIPVVLAGIVANGMDPSPQVGAFDPDPQQLGGIDYHGIGLVEHPGEGPNTLQEAGSIENYNALIGEVRKTHFWESAAEQPEKQPFTGTYFTQHSWTPVTFQSAIPRNEAPASFRGVSNVNFSFSINSGDIHFQNEVAQDLRTNEGSLDILQEDLQPFQVIFRGESFAAESESVKALNDQLTQAQKQTQIAHDARVKVEGEWNHARNEVTTRSNVIRNLLLRIVRLVGDLETERANLGATQANLAAVQTERDTTRNERDQAQTLADASGRIVERLDSRIQQNHNNYLQRLRVIALQLMAAGRERDTANTDLGAVQRQNGQLTLEIQALRQQLENLERDRDDAMARADDAERERDNFLVENTRLTQQVRDTEAENQRLDQQHQQLTQQLVDRDAELAQARAQLAAMGRRSGSVATKNNALEKALRELQRQLTKAVEERALAEDDRNTTRDQLTVAHKALADAERELVVARSSVKEDPKTPWKGERRASAPDTTPATKIRRRNLLTFNPLSDGDFYNDFNKFIQECNDLFRSTDASGMGPVQTSLREFQENKNIETLLGYKDLTSKEEPIYKHLSSVCDNWWVLQLSWEYRIYEPLLKKYMLASDETARISDIMDALRLEDLLNSRFFHKENITEKFKEVIKRVTKYQAAIYNNIFKEVNERVTAFRSSRWYKDKIDAFVENLKGDLTNVQIERALLQHLKEGFVTSSDEDKQEELDAAVELTFGEHPRYKRALTSRAAAGGAGVRDGAEEEIAAR